MNTSQIFGGLFLIAALLGWLLVIPWIPLESQRPLNASFLANVPGPEVFVYWGYPGCQNACPSTLASLAQLAREEAHRGHIQELQVIFLNLATALPSSLAQKYAQGFDPSFQGITLPPEELQQIAPSFGITLPQPITTAFLNEHLNFTYLLTRTSEGWQLAFIYPNISAQQQQAQQDLQSLRQKRLSLN